MRYLSEYVLYTSCYTAAFNTDKVDMDDLLMVTKKHMGCYAVLLGLHHGKMVAAPLSPKDFDDVMAAQEDVVAGGQPPAHAPGDAAERTE